MWKVEYGKYQHTQEVLGHNVKCDAPSELAWGVVRITTPRTSFIYHIRTIPTGQLGVYLNEDFK